MKQSVSAYENNLKLLSFALKYTIIYRKETDDIIHWLQ